MADERPDPDAVLARVLAEERQGRRGQLRIFFGYAAGVGKTYTMLQTAHRAAAEGRRRPPRPELGVTWNRAIRSANVTNQPCPPCSPPFLQARH